MRGLILSNSDHLIVHSRLPPVALAEKMRTLIGEGKDAEPVDGVWGRGNEQELTLFTARSEGSSPLEYRATLEPQASGTRIDGRFGGLKLLTYIKLMFLGIGSIFLVIGLWLLMTGAPRFLALTFIGLPLAQWALLFGILHVFNRGKTKDRAAILAFMKKHMDLVDTPERQR